MMAAAYRCRLWDWFTVFAHSVRAHLDGTLDQLPGLFPSLYMSAGACCCFDDHMLRFTESYMEIRRWAHRRNSAWQSGAANQVGTT